MENAAIEFVDLTRFLTLPGEALLFAKRKHPLVLLPPLLFIVLITLFFIAASIFASMLFPHPLLFVAIDSLLILMSVIVLVKIIVEWYLHVYMVTTHKIMEVWHRPFFSHVINGVYLDQVRATEVDMHRRGLISELLDIGDIVITFDRPTHEEEFVFAGIAHPGDVALFLSKFLHRDMGGSELIWYKERSINKAKGGVLL